MQKIPTLFVRNPADPKYVLSQVHPDCAWVLAGQGTATEKIDGTACLVHHGRFYRRHRVKEGKAQPPGWIHWDFDPEQASGHGWAPVTDSTADQYHREALVEGLADGTYELVGPRWQGNPYGLERHALWKHGDIQLIDVPRDFVGIAAWLAAKMEGVVWHHPDGRMAKIKRRDFGIPWPVKS